MKSKVQTWIRLARKIGKQVLASSEERTDEGVEEWMNQSSRNERIFKELKEPGFYLEKMAKKKEIEQRYTWDEFVKWRGQRERRQKLFIVRYVAAAVILFSLGTFVWGLNSRFEKQQVTLTSGIKPGGPRASLILNNGQEVLLDKQMCMVEADSSVVLNNKEGELSYRNIRENQRETGFNTLKVPCGGEYQLILADGTMVRVNSGSELIFPTRFNGEKREIFLKGEAYFQVAYDSKKPFYVRVHDYAVRVTGTAFNVTSYSDESRVMTTLVEGSISVIGNDSAWNYDLTPGHILSFDRETSRVTTETCDPRIYTSWVDGEFKFRDMRLEDIMKKLNRWYNFQVEFEDEALRGLRFSGAAEKYNPLEYFLKMIESITKVKFDIKGEKIVIKNNKNRED